MADRIVCLNQAETQEDMFSTEIPVVTLWGQLEPDQQKQLAQVLAELIRRMRRSSCREATSDEGQ